MGQLEWIAWLEMHSQKSHVYLGTVLACGATSLVKYVGNVKQHLERNENQTMPCPRVSRNCTFAQGNDTFWEQKVEIASLQRCQWTMVTYDNFPGILFICSLLVYQQYYQNSHATTQNAPVKVSIRTKFTSVFPLDDSHNSLSR